VRHGVTGLVALIFTALALPPLLARLPGGRPSAESCRAARSPCTGGYGARDRGICQPD